MRSPGSARGWLWASTSLLGGIASLLLLSATATLLAELSLADRQAARTVDLSTEERPSDVFVRLSLDIWDGQRIHVSHIAPVGAADDSVLPPGMHVFPEPGQAVVSPALDALAKKNVGLGQLYPQRTVLSDAGVGNSTELVAYVRPASGRALGVEAGALRFDNGVLVGDRITARVGAFGEGSGLPVFADEARPWWPRFGIAMGLALPLAFFVLALGVRVTGRAGGRSTSRSNAPLLVPGALLAGAAWLGMAARAQSVPFTQVPFVQGERQLLLTLVIVAVAMGSALVVLHLVPMRVRAVKPRSTLRGWRVRASFAPLACSALLFAAHALSGLGGTGLPVLPVASGLALVGACLALPAVLGEVGQQLTTSPHDIPAEVGRCIERDPRGAAAPFYAMTALVVLAQLLLPAANEAEPVVGVGGPAGLSAVGVEWFDTRPGDVAAFDLQLTSGVAFAVGIEGDGEPVMHAANEAAHVHEAESPLLVGADCAELARVMGLDCEGPEAKAVDRRMVAELTRLVTMAWGQSVDELQVVDPADLSGASKLLVVGTESLADLDAAVRIAARAALPAALVESRIYERTPDDSSQKVFDSLARWLFLALGVAVLLLAIDRLLTGARRRGPSVGELGRDPSRRHLIVRFLVAGGTAGLMGVVVGHIARLQALPVGQGEQVWKVTGAVSLALLGGGALATLTIWTLGHERRSSRQDSIDAPDDRWPGVMDPH